MHVYICVQCTLFTQPAESDVPTRWTTCLLVNPLWGHIASHSSGRRAEGKDVCVCVHVCACMCMFLQSMQARICPSTVFLLCTSKFKKPVPNTHLACIGRDAYAQS